MRSLVTVVVCAWGALKCLGVVCYVVGASGPGAHGLERSPPEPWSVFGQF